MPRPATVELSVLWDRLSAHFPTALVEMTLVVCNQRSGAYLIGPSEDNLTHEKHSDGNRYPSRVLMVLAFFQHCGAEMGPCFASPTLGQQGLCVWCHRSPS